MSQNKPRAEGKAAHLHLGAFAAEADRLALRQIGSQPLLDLVRGKKPAGGIEAAHEHDTCCQPQEFPAGRRWLGDGGHSHVVGYSTLDHDDFRSGRPKTHLALAAGSGLSGGRFPCGELTFIRNRDTAYRRDQFDCKRIAAQFCPSTDTVPGIMQ
ncbi:hypothetical protein [Sinorhizobium meliloti]